MGPSTNRVLDANTLAPWTPLTPMAFSPMPRTFYARPLYGVPTVQVILSARSALLFFSSTLATDAEISLRVHWVETDSRHV